MSDSNSSQSGKKTGLNPDITRRDFIGSTLIGSGAALLTMKAPALMREAQAAAYKFKLGHTIPLPLTGLGPDWTGPGGVGDYADANGNTWKVVNAAHALRDDNYRKMLANAVDTGETVELAIVGAGFAGLGAAYRWHQQRPDDSILLFDVHPIFGGEAKQNEFEVDGYHLWGPQGSNGNVLADGDHP